MPEHAGRLVLPAHRRRRDGAALSPGQRPGVAAGQGGVPQDRQHGQGFRHVAGGTEPTVACNRRSIRWCRVSSYRSSRSTGARRWTACLPISPPCPRATPPTWSPCWSTSGPRRKGAPARSTSARSDRVMASQPSGDYLLPPISSPWPSGWSRRTGGRAHDSGGGELHRWAGRRGADRGRRLLRRARPRLRHLLERGQAGDARRGRGHYRHLRRGVARLCMVDGAGRAQAQRGRRRGLGQRHRRARRRHRDEARRLLSLSRARSAAATRYMPRSASSPGRAGRRYDVRRRWSRSNCCCRRSPPRASRTRRPSCGTRDRSTAPRSFPAAGCGTRT